MFLRFLPKPDSPCIYLETNNGPDGCAIYFKTSKFVKIRKTCRVLRAWGARSNQVIFAFALRHKKSGKEILVATTHLKAKLGKLQTSFRKEQAKDIHSWLEAIQGSRPIILAGDFNGVPSEPFFSTIVGKQSNPLMSSYSIQESDSNKLEYTTWKIRDTGEQKHVLDYIFHSPSFKTVATLKMPSEKDLGIEKLPSAKFPSDHMSLVADIKMAIDDDMII